MSDTSRSLTFTSHQYPIQPGEDDETNPGVFGRSLAEWIGIELVPSFSPDDIIAEDFAWLVRFPHEKCSLYAACASDEDAEHGWRIMVFAEGGWLARVKLNDPRPQAVADLFAKIKARLEQEDGISNVIEE